MPPMTPGVSQASGPVDFATASATTVLAAKPAASSAPNAANRCRSARVSATTTSPSPRTLKPATAASAARRSGGVGGGGRGAGGGEEPGAARGGGRGGGGRGGERGRRREGADQPADAVREHVHVGGDARGQEHLPGLHRDARQARERRRDEHRA